MNPTEEMIQKFREVLQKMRMLDSWPIMMTHPEAPMTVRAWRLFKIPKGHRRNCNIRKPK